jgi:ACT domain-containing protein
MSTQQVQKQKVGRPAVVNESTICKLEAAISSGFSVTTACHLSGISTSTFYEYKGCDESFATRMKLADEVVTYRARQVILQEIDKGNLKAAIYWLERKARVEFAPPKPM